LTVLDLASLLLLLSAAWVALRVAGDWAPRSAARHQIALEIQTETAALKTRWALGILCFSTLLWILGITLVLPGVVPGAMCGTGVMQATGGRGTQALLMRLAGCAALYCWLILDRFNRLRPDAPLTVLSSRVLLAVFPLVLVAFLETARSIRLLDTLQPVDCCAVVYDQVRGVGTAAGMPWGDIAGVMVLPFAVTGSLLAAAALSARFLSGGAQRTASAVQALAALVWIPMAVFVTIRVFAAYHFQVLHHHCPWCLFLPEHRLVGFPIFAALAVVALEAAASVIAMNVGRRFKALFPEAERRSKTAGLRVGIAVCAYVIFAVAPVFLWRIRYGVWIG